MLPNDRRSDYCHSSSDLLLQSQTHPYYHQNATERVYGKVDEMRDLSRKIERRNLVQKNGDLTVLHVSEEGFRRSIVQAVSFPGHRLDAAQFPEISGEAWMGIVESLVRLHIGSEQFVLCVSRSKFFEGALDQFKI